MPEAGDGGRRATVLSHRDVLLEACRSRIVAVTLDVDGTVAVVCGIDTLYAGTAAATDPLKVYVDA